MVEQQSQLIEPTWSVGYASFATMLNALSDAALIVDANGFIVTANRLALALLGTVVEHLAGQPFYIISCENDIWVEATLVAVLQSRVPQRLAQPSKLRTLVGLSIPVSGTWAPLCDTNGNVVGASLIFSNSKHQQHTEHEMTHLLTQMRDQRQRLNNIVADVPGVVWESWGVPSSREQRMAFVSNYAERLLGYDVEMWLDTPCFWLDIMHPDDRARAALEHDLVFQNGGGGTTQFRWLAKNGRVVWVESHSVVILDEQRQPVGMHGVTMDITQRKLTEQERDRLLARERELHSEAEEARRKLLFLAEASSMLADIVDHQEMVERIAELVVRQFADWCAIEFNYGSGQPNLVITHRSEQRAVFAQPQLLDVAAAKVQFNDFVRALRTQPTRLCSPILDEQLRSAAHDEAQLETLQALGLHSAMHVPITTRERRLGTMVFVTAESRRYYDQSDLAIAEDLGQRLGAALENLLLYRELQQAVQARDQFLSIASHELKTPLTSLLGYADLLERRVSREMALKERDLRALSIIHDQALRLNRLITALLDISRIQTGQLSIEHNCVDVRSLIERIATEVVPTLGQQHTLVTEIGSEPLFIDGDEQRLEQVVQNLLQNAVKYSPTGGEIWMRLEQQEGFAAIRVSDQGIGIPEVAIPQLFGRFYRAGNVDAQHISGMGMGLFIVKEVVLLHGGVVHVDSNEGEGSTFTVLLPLIEPPVLASESA